MKPFLPILTLLLATFATGAEAGGVDCAKAASRLDKTICGDPVMLDYDGRIVAATDRASAMWGGAAGAYVKRDQQEWLTGFRAIDLLDAATETDCVLSDTACVRDVMRRRVDDLESSAYAHSGVYRSAGGMKLLLHPGQGSAYRLRIYDPARANEVNIITLEDKEAARWDGTATLVSVMGDANGLPLGREDGCTLRIDAQPLRLTVTQQGACQGHRFDGSYNRLLGETLRSYELELS